MMATETRLEALRSLTIAIGIFTFIAGMSFAWAAIESQQQTATAVHQPHAVAALP
jgi:hypothetical protein